MRRLAIGFVLFMELGGFAVAAPDDPGGLARQLIAARQDVKSHMPNSYDEVPDGTQAAQKSVAHEWSLIEDLVSAELTGRGNSKIYPAVDGLDVSTATLDADTMVVSATLDGLGTVFVIKRQNGEFQPVWRIRDLSSDQLTSQPLLGAHGIEGATGACNGGRMGDHPEWCGPMTAGIASLGDDDRGRPYFTVNGYYSAQQGNDVGYELSVWRWDGSSAVPVLVGGYGQTLEIAVGLTFQAPFLSLHVKDGFQTFYVTAPEPGRQMTWTILMVGDGVRDLGKTTEVPELDAVDALLARILRGGDTDDIAAPKVRATLEDALEKQNIAVDRGPNADIDAALGELDDSVLARRRKSESLCFSTDNLGFFRFTLRRKNGVTFISKVRQLADLDSRDDPCTQGKSK
jgi:hypothetical protein